ncbi:transcriptional regulator [West African Asystasia virus 2]|uniref:Transcriptional activator protein n=1 Tax=West African Asystasia virus 2 TaxID=1046574 RepID=G9CM34_9GEMI|nr:transcriptional regulator [West African Asystasia virus 2]AEI91439.1 transcriptional regulator [West African Asystasia virus 2]
MHHSSPSSAHSTQVPIKVSHRLGKRKPIRRKRIDLNCGCTYFLHINCTNHGFTHRGEHHCSSGQEWRLYLGNIKSPVFQDPQPRRPTNVPTMGHNQNTSEIQPQPEEGIGDSQMFIDLPGLDELTPSDFSFLKSI